MLDVVLIVYIAPVLAACAWAYRRVPIARTFLACAASGHALSVLIGVDRMWGEGRSGPVASAVVMSQAGLFFAAALALLRTRRKQEGSVGFADGFAAFVGIVVVYWQWLSFGEGATARTVAAQMVVFVSCVALAAVLAIFGGVALDRTQDRRLISTVSVTGLLLLLGVAVSDNYAHPDRGARGAACHLVAAYLLTRFYRSPHFPRLFGPDPPRRRLFSLRWAGPACALIATPTIVAMFMLGDRVPSVWAGLAGAVLTAVALWRGTALFQDRERARRELLGEQRFRALVEHGADVIVIVNDELRIAYVSGAADAPFVRAAGASTGTPVIDMFDPADGVHLLEAFSGLHEDGAGVSLDRDLRLCTSDGEAHWVTVRLTNRLGTPTIGGWVLNIHDITERKRAEDSLAMLAHQDSLTGLPNRVALRNSLQQVLTDDDGTTVLLFCDLDGFKAVNDHLGHDAGDEVLRAVAGRWSFCLRADDVLGRWGGDEFLVVCPGMPDSAAVEMLTDRLREALTEPVYVAGSAADIGVSIGVARHLPGESADDLIGRTDAAMYQVKQGRRASR